MTTQKKSNTNKYRIIVSGLFGLCLVLIILTKTNVIHFTEKDQPNNIPTTPFDTSTKDQRENEAAINAANKQQSINSDTSQAQPDPETSQSIILSAKSENNGTVTILAKLYGYSSGNCDLTIVNSSATLHKVAPVIYAPEYSTCAGFSITKTNPGAGEWTITLSLDSNGTVDTKSINFTVD